LSSIGGVLVSAGPGQGPSDEPENLLALALSRPQDALLAARSILASRPEPYEASIACHAAGIVLRDRGEVADAIKELRRGLTFAKASGRPEREIDVRATLGVALVWIGRTRQGLIHLDTAVQEAHGLLAGRVLLRRASALRNLGRYRAALDDLSVALPLLRRAGDQAWEARALSHRAIIYLLYGAIARAKADFTLAEELFFRTGQEFEYAIAWQNRAAVAITQGDAPMALKYLAEAAERYDAVGTRHPDLAIDRITVLLTAGLAREAMHEADLAAAGRGPADKRAELLHHAAIAALAIPDPQAAVDRAQRARRLFRAQGRDLWRSRSELVLLQARYATGRRSTQLLNQTAQLAENMERPDPEHAQRAHLLAGRIAIDLGQMGDAERHLGQAAGTRRSSPPLVRSLGSLARALLAEAKDDVRATLAACRSGLAALDEHRLTLGSTELRARATAHGAELAAIAQRLELRGGNARRLLAASERWRATAQASPAVGQVDEAGLAEPLTALRAIVRQLNTGGTEGPATAILERERRRLESTIRERSLQLPGGPGGTRNRFDPAELADVLTAADTRLVELIEVDGTVQVLTVVGRRVRRYPRGPIPTRLVEHARFLLRRTAEGAAGEHLDELLDEVGRRLQDALLGPAIGDLGDDVPLVIVPPGPLHAVPWALLPVLRNREISVTPSASMFLQVRRLVAPQAKQVTFVGGPGLSSGGGEVHRLAADYPDATVLSAGTATADNVLSALDGGWLAHVAAHGSFRSDNPLFSALELDDGPLTVHDFERLAQAPYRLILPCCDSGVGAPVGADELLGLVSSLVPLGSAGILASVVPINDQATVPLMVGLHAALRSGANLPQALLAARTDGAKDRVSLATGYSFTAFGT
jgi:tetratricopeptide (TPR) repeat protein